MPLLAEATLDDVLERMAAVISTEHYPNQLYLGKSGAGKTRLMRRVLAWTAPADRVAVFDPKPADDPSWTLSDDDIGPAPAPVTSLAPGFGSQYEGGGPLGLWFRVPASRDPAVTTTRFTGALRRIGSEGACITVLDDARTLNKSLRLSDVIEDSVLLGRSGRQSCLISSQDPGYVAVRSQVHFRFIGHTGSLASAKAAAGLLGMRGTAWEDFLAGLRPGEWVYDDDAPGNPGPCVFRSWDPAA
jgi:hypothetical protein